MKFKDSLTSESAIEVAVTVVVIFEPPEVSAGTEIVNVIGADCELRKVTIVGVIKLSLPVTEISIVSV